MEAKIEKNEQKNSVREHRTDEQGIVDVEGRRACEGMRWWCVLTGKSNKEQKPPLQNGSSEHQAGPVNAIMKDGTVRTKHEVQIVVDAFPAGVPFDSQALLQNLFVF